MGPDFARIYPKICGRTPVNAVEAIRIDAARRQLEQASERIVRAALGVLSTYAIRNEFGLIIDRNPKSSVRRYRSPDLEGPRPQESVMSRSQQMSRNAKQIIDDTCSG
jgi:hypothetical protein